MKIETEDYTTWITDTGVINDEPYKDYENTDGKKWRVYGTCNACGMCEMPEEIQVNFRIHPETGERDTYTRVLNWVNEPGIAGACLEENFEERKDIPMTPDCINDLPDCTLRGEWIENGN
jgi:hypothetical protein